MAGVAFRAPTNPSARTAPSHVIPALTHVLRPRRGAVGCYNHHVIPVPTHVIPVPTHVIPATHHVIPALTHVIPALTHVIPVPTYVIPAKAGIYRTASDAPSLELVRPKFDLPDAVDAVVLPGGDSGDAVLRKADAGRALAVE